MLRAEAASTSAPTPSGVLSVDLGAIVANYRALCARAAPAACAVVMKADAYGIEAGQVLPPLLNAGCREIFVAQLEEGIRVRALVGPEPTITVLHGAFPGDEPLFAVHGLRPVLNSVEQVGAWALFGQARGRPAPSVIQVDSGMTRFGLAPAEALALAADGALLEHLDARLIMSHLACADEPEHPANRAQLAAFRELRAGFAGLPASLAASSGIFLGADYLFDVVRPGAALYGIAPQAGRANPLRLAIRLQGRVLQVRDVPEPVAVGYGHTARAAGRLATVAVGYADGFLRSASGRGVAYLDGHAMPIVGRISMDSLVLDVSAVPHGLVARGVLVDLIGPDNDLDAAGRAAGTIGYEILTSLGTRFARRYLPA